MQINKNRSDNDFYAKTVIFIFGGNGLPHIRHVSDIRFLCLLASAQDQ
jgi:hypothetical protein